MCKVNLEEDQNVDYIFCLSYEDSQAVQTNFLPLELTDTTVSCNLGQRQRSSQQILDLADYVMMHSSYDPIRRWNSPTSFSSEIPLWIELDETAPSKSEFYYFTENQVECKDVMVIWDSRNKPDDLTGIEEFCKEQNWRCTERSNIRGSEASVTILYDLYYFDYEYLTRAKTQLVIVTIAGKQRYFLSISKLFCFLK